MMDIDQYILDFDLDMSAIENGDLDVFWGRVVTTEVKNQSKCSSSDVWKGECLVEEVEAVQTRSKRKLKL